MRKFPMTDIWAEQSSGSKDGSHTGPTRGALAAALKSWMAAKPLYFWGLIFAIPTIALAVVPSFAPQASQFSAAGALAGDQTNPQLSIRPSGGYMVWQDNITDGNGLGISARRLDNNLSGTLGVFRVNVQGTNDQENPQVAVLNNGGAVFAWQGGKQGFQNIFARFMSPSNTWLTFDVMVNTFTNSHRAQPAVASLSNGGAVVTWSSFDQDGSMQGVYLQLFSATGQKIGNETQVNQTTLYNQRAAVVTGLSDGRIAVVWVSEQQRFQNSVDVYGRFFTGAGVAAGNEFLINTGTNICANPSIAASSDGGFAVAWGQKDIVARTDSWDIFARTVSSTGVGGTVRRVNTQVYGDQFAPRISSVGSDYMVVWTSLGQDGSREGVFGQMLNGSGALAGSEFRVNTTTVSQQIHPALASDGASRFLVAWSSFGGGVNSFDLFAQRYALVTQPLNALAAPFVNVLSSNALAVSWPPLAGFDIANYEIYADGAATATAAVTNNSWTMTGLAPSSTHSFQIAYVLTDGRRSPVSPPASATTYGAGATWGGIPQEWMIRYFGNDMFSWPSPTADSDGDGADNLKEFLAGTDPTNANSVLRVNLQLSPQGLFLNWNTQPGLMYQVETSVDFKTWTALGSPRFAAGSVDSMYVGVSSSSTSKYRVVRLR